MFNGRNLYNDVLSVHPSPQTAIEIEEPTVNNADGSSPSNSSPAQQPTPVQTTLHCQNQPSPPCVGTISSTCTPPSPPSGTHQCQSQPLCSTISWPAVPAATVTDSSESFSPVGIQGNMVAASHESCVSNNTPSCSIQSDTTCLVSSNNTPIVYFHSSNQSFMNPSARLFIPLPQTLTATNAPSNPNARISQQQSQSLRSILLQPLVPPTATPNHSAMGLSRNSSDASRGLHVVSNAPSGSNLPAVNVQSNTTNCSSISMNPSAIPSIPPPQQLTPCAITAPMLMNQTVPVPPTARTTHPQIQEAISQTKQALGSEFNARILCLEEEVRCHTSSHKCNSSRSSYLLPEQEALNTQHLLAGIKHLLVPQTLVLLPMTHKYPRRPDPPTLSHFGLCGELGRATPPKWLRKQSVLSYQIIPGTLSQSKGRSDKELPVPSGGILSWLQQK